MAGETFPLGPGTLTIGATGTAIDVSCLVNDCTLTVSKDEGDSTTKLCGITRPGAVTYSYALSGNIDTDIADPDGLFALGHTAPGSQQPFEFIPNTEAGTSASGTLVLDPLDFGGDTSGETMTADFEFTVVDRPTWQIGTGGTTFTEALPPPPEPVEPADVTGTSSSGP